jgi:hypothetical protein
MGDKRKASIYNIMKLIYFDLIILYDGIMCHGKASADAPLAIRFRKCIVKLRHKYKIKKGNK